MPDVRAGYRKVGKAMAKLPSEQFLIQQVGGDVILFEQYTEREIVRVPCFVKEGEDSKVNKDGFARAQKTVFDSDLSPEDKCYAHFWFGYFYAYAANFTEVPL
jgi:hypothetical protein